MRHKILYWVCAAGSGAIWAVVVLGFGYGAPAAYGFVSVSPTLVCGVLTGLAISAIFKKKFVSTSGKFWWLLPLATLAISILIFSILTWGYSYLWSLSSHEKFMQLGEIVSFYVVGCFLSIFVPLFYGIALANQYLMRSLVKRAA